jgi:hypothetical protein
VQRLPSKESRCVCVYEERNTCVRYGITCSVSDLHPFHVDPEPAPNLNADPDPGDNRRWIHADLDPVRVTIEGGSMRIWIQASL